MTNRKRPDHAVTIEQRIGLHHCDPLGVAWHGRYFEWFEAARTALFASIDLDVPQIRAFGFRMYIVDAHCRYMAPLAYGDLARVTAWFVATAPLIRVAYDVHHAATGRHLDKDVFRRDLGDLSTTYRELYERVFGEPLPTA